MGRQVSPKDPTRLNEEAFRCQGLEQMLTSTAWSYRSYEAYIDPLGNIMPAVDIRITSEGQPMDVPDPGSPERP